MGDAHKGEIRFSFPSGSGWGAHNIDNYVCEIILEDTASHTHPVTIRLRVHEFAKMMSQRSAECDFEIGPTELVGMRHEHKTERVAINETAALALRPFEIDGWTARKEDYGNNHRKVGQAYDVVFFRHVAQSDDPAMRRGGGR